MSDSIAKILEREPDWSALPATTPASIRRLLLRCLAKDPKKRLRDIGDVRIEIDAVDEVLPGFALTPAAAPATSRVARWLPWAALAALAVAVGAWQALRPVPFENPLPSEGFKRLTDWAGSEGYAEISPDGKVVAFLADRDGELDFFSTQLGTERFNNLTAAASGPRIPSPSCAGPGSLPIRPGCGSTSCRSGRRWRCRGQAARPGIFSCAGAHTPGVVD